ncbi:MULTISPECIES: SIS domain-containing protein [unclassified Acidocella]|uniref:D-sedoheptulose-7-phosphate isomerase n=1 Tax=unclassified Acidocella TaxID=2648610 RepID=UPI00028DAFED|nr:MULTISPECIES: SIS domain-containing protein [unclassified Acidocella]EKM99058.1 phosphoheptose isomerase [Acidocella sp. MX-AZ02]WBO58505.1 SIS domain-containing protein [Acidocella sp. MX-AZ03]
MQTDEKARYAAMLRRGAELKLALAEQAEPVLAIVDACERALRQGGKLIFCGNGGSAADAQHLATELVIRLRGAVPRASWPAITLALDTSAVTAAVNDFGIDEMFSRPLEGLGRAGDVLFGITTSGKSANVLGAVKKAKEMGIISVGLLGGDGGPALPLCDLAIVVPDTETARIQECHIALGHAILTLMEDRLVRQ